MSIFNNKSDTSIEKFNNYNNCDYIDFEKKEDLSSIDINKISYSVKKIENLVTITINVVKNEEITYYIGKNPLTDSFLTSNIFTFNSLDSNDYYLAIKNENDILIIFDNINISTI